MDDLPLPSARLFSPVQVGQHTIVEQNFSFQVFLTRHRAVAVKFRITQPLGAFPTSY